MEKLMEYKEPTNEEMIYSFLKKSHTDGMFIGRPISNELYNKLTCILFDLQQIAIEPMRLSGEFSDEPFNVLSRMLDGFKEQIEISREVAKKKYSDDEISKFKEYVLNLHK